MTRKAGFDAALVPARPDGPGLRGLGSCYPDARARGTTLAGFHHHDGGSTEAAARTGQEAPGLHG
jgi:hypothetical protein